MSKPTGDKMNYDEVVKRGLVLPKKEKYTMVDVNKLVTDSLFAKDGTIGWKEALWIVQCSAVYHGTTWSKSVSKTRHDLLTQGKGTVCPIK